MTVFNASLWKANVFGTTNYSEHASACYNCLTGQVFNKKKFIMKVMGVLGGRRQTPSRDDKV